MTQIWIWNIKGQFKNDSVSLLFPYCCSCAAYHGNNRGHAQRKVGAFIDAVFTDLYVQFFTNILQRRHVRDDARGKNLNYLYNCLLCGHFFQKIVAHSKIILASRFILDADMTR